MTQKHTPEPWYVFSHYSDHEIRTKDGDKLVSAMLPSKIYDARRIVACVNACSGIPDEQLECDNVEFVRIFNERNMLKNQHDELLAALEKWQTAANLNERLAAHANGYKVLSNVKGGA